MNNHHTFNDLLDLWVKDELTLDDLTLITGKTNSEELLYEATLHKSAVVSIQKFAIAQQVASVHQNYLATLSKPSNETRVISINSRKMLQRIAVAAAIFFGLFLTVDRLLVNPDMIYRESYQEYYGNTERSASVEELQNIAEYFRVGNYQAVIEAFGLINEPANKEVFLAGYSYLKIENYDQAEKLFNTIIQNANAGKENLFRDEAEYYLALTCLKLGKYYDAYMLMKAIRSNPDHTYSDAFDSWSLLRTKWLD
ncbi:MAG: hypothetical protein MUE71_07070 [Chitinophagaceae bacterium]|jgi:tetratricopeptide (TPR) repeat protein|nr:hypothetical protein [Chitinophagaceae bacterium]MCU0404209.1 hypothetical protein [Chitinophagaceae bacterium]